MRFKNYKNNYTNDNRIYSNEELYNMPLSKLVSLQQELGSQYSSIGFPSVTELSKSDNVVYVHAYTRDDGTKVCAHWRSKPYSGTNTGGADSINDNKKDINVLDKIQEFAYENGLHNLFPMSSDATINGMHDMEAANKDKNATVLDNLDAVNNSRNKAYLKSMGAKEQDKGVIYDEHSAVAINFKNSPELNMHIAEIRDDVINNRPLKDKKITFSSNKEDIISSNDKIDRHAFIHDAMIVDQKVDENGIYTCKILDYSNFENKKIETLLDIPNNWGYDMQQRDLYKNYYIIINIRKKVNW